MSLKQTGFFISVSIAVLFFVLALSLVVFTSQIRGAADQLFISVESIRLSEEIHIELLSTNREMRLYHFTKEPKHWENVAKSKKKINELLLQSKGYVAGDEELELLGNLETKTEIYLEHLVRNIEGTAQSAYLSRSQDLEQAIEASKALTDLNIAQAREMQSASAEKDNLANVFGSTMFVMALLLCGTLLLIIRFWILRPVDRLQRAISNFSVSEERIDIPESGPQEIVHIAASFNSLSSKLMSQREAQLRFLASVAHDLKNPLGAIKMSAQLLEDEGLTADQKSIVEIIGRQAVHLERMVGDFLDASRIEAGNLEIKPSPTDLRRLVADAVGLHKSMTTLHEIKSELPSSPVVANCDPTRISQVLNNLINNAIKYSPHGGEISIGLRTTGEFATLEVQDQGIGIGDSDKEKIFEPFQRTALTKASIPGVGLGLSVSKKIVECHGGSISIESRLQNGTKFVVQIPKEEIKL